MLRRIFSAFLLLILALHVSANQPEYPPITPENVMNLQELEIIGQGSSNSSLAWSPDGSRILTGGAQGIFIFDSNYQNIGFIDLGKPVTILQFAPDGTFVFAGFDGKINAFDLETQTVRYQLDGGSILAISQNGELLAYSGYRSVIVADIATGETRYVLDYREIWRDDYSYDYGYQHYHIGFAQFYENDQKLVVSWIVEIGEYYDEDVYQNLSYTTDFWTLTTSVRQNLGEIDTTNEADFAVFDDAGNLVMINWGDHFYREADSTQVWLTEGNQDYSRVAYGGSYLLQGNLLATPMCSHNSSYCDSHEIIVWDIQTEAMIARFPKMGRISFSPDGTKIAIANEVFAIPSGERLAILQNDSYRALSGGSDRILQYSADDSLRLLDAATMDEIAIMPIKRSELGEIRDIFSDGSFLLVHKNLEQYIRISGVIGAEIMRIEVETDFWQPRLSENERYFSLSLGNYVIESVWDATTGERIEFPAGFIPMLSHFESNQLIGWTGSSIGFFDLIQRDYVEQIAVEQHFQQPVSAIDMSGDEQYLAIHFGKEGLVIRRATGEIIASFTTDAVFNLSSSLLAYSDAERNVFIMSLHDEEIINQWYIQSDMPFFGGLGFQNDEILNVYMGGPDGGSEVVAYEARTGYKALAIYPQYQPAPILPFAESNGLRFYNDNGIRIEWNEQPISLRLIPANFNSAALSSDGSRLYINYTDGRLGIWAVGE